MKSEIRKGATNILLALNDLDIKEFKNKKSFELTEEELKELNTLLNRCNEIIKKEGYL